MPSETISPSEGSLGTIVTIKGYCRFGSKKGKVLVGGTAVKVTEWTTDSITGLISKVPKAGPGNCDVLVVAKEPKGVLPLSRKGAFTVKAPEITTLDPHGAALTEVTLDGNFFGTKKGKVVLEIGGKLKSCKVVEWWMEAATGESRVKFLVPKGIIAGTYPLKMINKVETGETQFKID
jgi:hypothetical protein